MPIQAFNETIDIVKGSYKGSDELAQLASEAGVKALGAKLAAKFVSEL